MKAMSLKERKNALRSRVMFLLEKLPKEELVSLAREAVEALSKNKHFQQADAVLSYHAFGFEIPFTDKLENLYPHKRFFYPSKEFWFKGKSGESFNPESFFKVVILVPAVAIDKNLTRLGRGGGYYDRVLPKLYKFNAHSISVIPRLAYLDHIPKEAHDVEVKEVIVIK